MRSTGAACSRSVSPPGWPAGWSGVGGGVLFVPALVVFADQSQLGAEATSLVAIVLVSVVGTWRQRGYGNVRLRDGLLIGALSPLGVLVGRGARQRGARAGARAGVRRRSSSFFAWQLARKAGTPLGSTPVEILDVSTEDRDGLVHVGLVGELDLSTVAKVQEELRRVEESSPPTVVLDLSKLTFLDSTGLRCIVTADERARDAGRRVVIVRGPDPVQRVFSITRLDERLEMVDDASTRSRLRAQRAGATPVAFRVLASKG